MTFPAQNREKIRTLLWNLACAGADTPGGIYMVPEYPQLVNLGFIFAEYKNRGEWLTNNSPDFQADFAFHVYYMEFGK